MYGILEAIFWRLQSVVLSGDRYFPVNLSNNYIYLNNFWAWYRDSILKNYEDEGVVQTQAALSAEQARLAAAIKPIEEPKIASSEKVRAIFNRVFNIERKEESIHDGGEALSDEMDDLVHRMEEAPEVVEDAISEAETKRLLKELQRDVNFPSFSTFMRARYDDEFNDVKKREKHFHFRCTQCADLTTLVRLAARDPLQKIEYEKMLKAHHFEVKSWRALEAQKKLHAKSRPDDEIVLSYDDTSAMGFPRTTNRPLKTLPKDRCWMVPFNITNHGTSENAYFYDFQGKWGKGSDRLCTILYTVLRRIKERTSGSQEQMEQKLARKLTLMGDNCSVNKSNQMFAFCTELVQRGWFDEVEMLFGPVGHTHNGNDAVHFVHNQIAGNYLSVTPAELFNNYKFAWADEHKRPQPVILESQWAWKARYKPLLNPVSGFSGTQSDPLYVRAFRFRKAPVNSEVEMHIKGSPRLDLPWHGQNSIVDAPGFRILKGFPEKAPLRKSCSYSNQERVFEPLEKSRVA